MLKFLKRDLTPYVIGGFICILIISVLLSINKPLSYTMTTSENPTVNTPVVVNFEVEKQMAKYSPDKFTVEVTNKYNSNDTYTFTIEPYQKGEYEFIFTPSFSGDYLINLTMVFDGTKQYFPETITINQ